MADQIIVQPDPTNSVVLSQLLQEQKRHGDLLERIDVTLRGDGSKEIIGVIVRLDRLEQEQDKRTWHFRALWAAVIAACLTVITTLLKV